MRDSTYFRDSLTFPYSRFKVHLSLSVSLGFPVSLVLWGFIRALGYIFPLRFQLIIFRSEQEYELLCIVYDHPHFLYYAYFQNARIDNNKKKY